MAAWRRWPSREPMLIALEAATDAGSVAVGRGGDLTGEVSIGVHARHAEVLLPALDFLMRSLYIERSVVRGVVVGAGPGSFTGVRVAAATARGLAHGLGVPLYAYSTLAALALDVATDRPVCAVLDARRGEVYAGVYQRHGRDGVTEVRAPEALQLSRLLEDLAPDWPLFAGAGAERYAAALPEPPVRAIPRASALLRLAAADPSGRIDDIAGWEPSYLRASGAERGIAG